MILTSKKVKDDSEILILEYTKSISSPVKLKIETLGDISDVKIEKDPDIALLDCSKLQFPLKIRIWQPGDKFMPFGMSGYKKISDFLVDIKVSLHQKNNVYVLLSGDDIAWVIGYRIDNRFRIDEQTSNVIKFSLT